MVAHPLVRCSFLAAALAVVMGCQSDRGALVRAQGPNDPLGPVAPAPPPGVAPAPAVAPAVGGAVAGTAPPAVAQTNFTVPALDPKTGTPRVKVVAVVGASLTVITDQEVRESVWQRNDELSRLEGREREAKTKELYTAALRRTIERELILDDMYAKLKKASKSNVIDEIKDSAVQGTDRRIRELKKQIGIKTDDEFALFLRIQGLTVQVLRRQYEREMMASQYVNSMLKEKGRRASLADVRDYYDKNPKDFATKDRVKWQHVFVSANKHGQVAAQRAEAIRQAASGGQDLGALSKQYDDGLAGAQNGLGVGERAGEIAQDLEATVLGLKAGELSAVIQTPTGYHIVKVLERDYAGVRPFDQTVQNAIRNKLDEQLYEADRAKMVEDLWRKGVVRVVEEP
jgi:peptidyl-prolyl cis-trans isomerase SurA